jgi:hypothetical protein
MQFRKNAGRKLKVRVEGQFELGRKSCMSACDVDFAASQQFGRYRSEADFEPVHLGLTPDRG